MAMGLQRVVPEPVEDTFDRYEILFRLRKLQEIMGGRDTQGNWGPYQDAVANAIAVFEDAHDFNKHVDDSYSKILLDPTPQAVD